MSFGNHVQVGVHANNLDSTNDSSSKTQIHFQSSIGASPAEALNPFHGQLVDFSVAPYPSARPQARRLHQGSFAEFPPHGHTFELPRNPFEPEEISRPAFIVDNFPTKSNSTSASLDHPRTMNDTLDTAIDLDGATIDVATDHSPGLGPPSMTETPSRPSRRNKKYTLADGTIVSGKGLGRGRPGVKRGPRHAKYHMGEEQDGSSLHIAGSPATDNALPIKRRRINSGASNPNIRLSSSSSLSLDSRESSIEYNPIATHTRSGRQTQKPLNLPTTKVIASPVSKTVSSNSPANVTPSSAIKTHPKIKRRVYRGREQFALCEHCLRGHGPAGNVIVFCDACNKCWHQRCHEPQISGQTVSDSKAEWFCSDCDRILHGKKGKSRVKGSVAPAKVAPPIPPAPTFVYVGPRVGGRLLNNDQKLAYLNTLSKEQLISLLMDGAYLAPDLPIFETLVQALPPGGSLGAQFTSTYVTPVSHGPGQGDADGVGGNEAADEGYDGYYDEHAALYPKPGFGVQLPPEREDLHMMLEGKETRTFSHWMRGMRGNHYSGTGNVSRV
ncbi:hypothetical protein LTR84_000707 [Exophiala bonariae]|uniref:PHD-type domain-containing protein n=1 Tax=Exophiala bonariae TaxID=1690606 RepID=A0AAV9NRN9_9EURO|nr:hypothetical protein LTR84_000707 [Exophiala bonariae]